MVPNADAAGPIVSLVFFILVALSGLYFPVKAGSGLATFTDYFPIRHLIVASVDTFNGLPGSSPWRDLARDRDLGRGGRLRQPPTLGLVAQARVRSDVDEQDAQDCAARVAPQALRERWEPSEVVRRENGAVRVLTTLVPRLGTQPGAPSHAGSAPPGRLG